MSFVSDVTPLVSGPHLRYLAAWIELITFALTLPSGFWIYSLIVFALTFFVVILDVVVALQRRKARKIQDTAYTFQPKVWIIVLDILIAVVYTLLWVADLYFGAIRLDSIDDVVYITGAAYNVFGAYVLVGLLCIVHLHLFFGAVELHTLKQQRKGNKAAARVHNLQQNEDAYEVELAPTRKGPSHA